MALLQTTWWGRAWGLTDMNVWFDVVGSIVAPGKFNRKRSFSGHSHEPLTGEVADRQERKESPAHRSIGTRFRVCSIPAGKTAWEFQQAINLAEAGKA